jgi:hypothetical protein
VATADHPQDLEALDGRVGRLHPLQPARWPDHALEGIVIRLIAWSGWNVHEVMPWTWAFPECWRAMAERTFWPHGTTSGLGLPNDFMNSLGVDLSGSLGGRPRLRTAV